MQIPVQQSLRTPLRTLPRRMPNAAHVVTLAATFALASLVLLAPTTLPAQVDSSGTVRGNVRVESGLPVAEALVTLRQTSDGCEVARDRTLGNGTFTLPKLVPGDYTLSVKRLGYDAIEVPLRVNDGVTRYTAVLTPQPALLGFSQLADGWTGVVGLVGDGETMAGLEGVRITRMGGGDPVTTDAEGRFVLPIEAVGPGALRVDRDGFEPRLVSYDVDPGTRSPAVVLLDSGSVSKDWASVWTDLNQRAKWSTPRTVRVSRQELLLTGSGSLLQALERAPTVKASGVIISRLACVFVDGLPRPSYPVDAIRTDRVEYVEAYPARTDLSRTLVNRWPPGAPCGAPGGDLISQRAIESGTGAYYVVVWTR
jgi:hypothetical protein